MTSKKIYIYLLIFGWIFIGIDLIADASSHNWVRIIAFTISVSLLYVYVEIIRPKLLNRKNKTSDE